MTSKTLVLRIQRQSGTTMFLLSWREIGNVPALMEKERERKEREGTSWFIDDIKSKKTVLASD